MAVRFISLFFVCMVATASLGSSNAVQGNEPDSPSRLADSKAIRQVVEMMNRAITERDLPKLIGTFAEGAIRVDSFPAHRFIAPDPEQQMNVQTADLKARWETVAPILFSTTEFYRRKVVDTSVHVDADLAVAWVDIETETLSKEQDAKIAKNAFKEICVLRRETDGWKILVMTNNRQDKIR